MDDALPILTLITAYTLQKHEPNSITIVIEFPGRLDVQVQVNFVDKSVAMTEKVELAAR